MVLFRGRRRVEELEAELAQAYDTLNRYGVMDQYQRERHRHEGERRLAQLGHDINAAGSHLAGLQSQITATQAALVQTSEEALLQEAGIYRFSHVLDSAVAYKARITEIKQRTRTLVTGRQAVEASTDWTVNGSRQQGAKMVKDFSTLMLRAYNAEADNCVRVVKPHTVSSACTRLEKTATTIERLGKTMSIRISPRYHALRIEEILLTADYQAKLERERELVREQREREKEEQRARKEFEREKAKLLKEQAHYEAVVERLRREGKTAEANELNVKLGDIVAAIRGVDERSANTRAGYVYVISNIGSFGPGVVKIGMTRRLEPMDRVRELGDASVPFRFDVHALIFSHDAVGLENSLHNALAESRVNQVNRHREFFRVSPGRVRDLLEPLVGNHLLEFTETPEALEWRQSGAQTGEASPPPPAQPNDSSAANTSAESPPAAPTPPTAASVHWRRSGDIIALPGDRQALLTFASGTASEIDPVALLLNSRGEVRTDVDLVFHGQPDHPSGALRLTADRRGEMTVLLLDVAVLPRDVEEVLMVLHASEPTRRHDNTLDVAGIDTVPTRVPLPEPGLSGLIQIGALQRDGAGWSLRIETAVLEMDLMSLVTAAGVSVD